MHFVFIFVNRAINRHKKFYFIIDSLFQVTQAVKSSAQGTLFFCTSSHFQVRSPSSHLAWNKQIPTVVEKQCNQTPDNVAISFVYINICNGNAVRNAVALWTAGLKSAMTQ